MQQLSDLIRAEVVAKSLKDIRISESACARLTATDASAYTDLVAHNSGSEFQALTTAIVLTLNSTSDEGGVSFKLKTNVLLLALKLAKEVPSGRSALLQSLVTLNSTWEQALTDKEVGREQYGTALGRTHEYMLVLLCRLCEYTLTSAQLLEFVNGKVAFALELVASVLKVLNYEIEVHNNVFQILFELTQPQTYFTTTATASVQEFSEKVNTLLTQTVKLRTLVTCCEALRPRLNNLIQPSTTTTTTTATVRDHHHKAIQNYFKYISNVYHFATLTPDVTSFRQSILISTPLVGTLLVPYIKACLTTLLTNPQNDGLILLLLRGLSLGLGLLALIAFRMSTHSSCVEVRKQTQPVILTAFEWVSTVSKKSKCGNSSGNIDHSVQVLVELFRVISNLDTFAVSSVITSQKDSGASSTSTSTSSSAPAPAEVITTLAKVLAHLPVSSLQHLTQKFVCQGCTSRTPVARDTFSYDMIVHTLERVLTSKKQQSSPPPPPQNISLSLGEESTPSPASDTFQALTQALDAELQLLETQQTELQSIHSDLTNLKSTPTSTEPSVKSSSEGNSSSSSSSLLGNLPPLRGRMTSKNSATTTATTTAVKTSGPAKDTEPSSLLHSLPQSITAPVIAPLNMPREFLCEINAHVMKTPMRSPYGHHFEKETIDYWLFHNGSICPLTGKPLRKEDLVVDTSLQERIVSWKFQQLQQKQPRSLPSASASASSASPLADTTEDELYQF